MRKFNKRQLLILIILSILLGGTALINLGNSDTGFDPNIMRLRYILVGISCLFLVLLSRFNMENFQIKFLPFLLVWVLFSFVLVISGLANNDLIVVRDGFWFMVGIPLIFFNALPTLMKEDANPMIALALFLGHIPYIITSLLLHPIDTSLYQGVFANSNQMGMTCAAIAASLFILLIAALSAKKSPFYIYSITFLLLGAFTLIFVSKSRTSLIAFFAMFSIFIWRIYPNKKNLINFFYIITFILSIILLLFISGHTQLLWKNIQDGFSTKTENGGLDGREEIWIKTLNDINLLGHGDSYFDSNFGLGGHNTVIDVIGKNGIIAAYLLIFLGIISFLYAFNYLKTYEKEDYYAVTPLVITTCFWIFSMAEGMFGSLGNAVTLAYMLSMGVILTKTNKNMSQRYR